LSAPATEGLAVAQIALERLEPAAWNANRVPPGILAKVRASIERVGIVENLVARPHPDHPGKLEVISGNHRLALYREMGLEAAPVVVVELDDAHARILAQTLNRTRGQDDPEAYAELLREVLDGLEMGEVLTYLPETEGSIRRLLATMTDGPDPDAIPSTLEQGPADSKAGVVYELGEHRLICGDATDPEIVKLLMGGESAALMATDPPYGVAYDARWRDAAALAPYKGGPKVKGKGAVSMTGKRMGPGRKPIEGDTRADWSPAFALTDAPVAYVWHGAMHACEVAASLEASGFELRQQIVWVKPMAPVGRAAYHWQHEPCWYAVRKGKTARWRNDRKETTVWEATSPLHIFGQEDKDVDVRTAHATQKPSVLFERAIVNHTVAGDVVYEPFCGSGTQLIAAERTGRRCFAVELDPHWCDVARKRWEAYRAHAAAA
jgi:DNA modification methylase